MKNNTITIYDIAREAQVSPATVSRILSGNARVSQEKKERVEKLVKKYSFVPNAMAQGLSTKESKSIGMLLSDVRNPFYSSLFVGIEKAAVRRGYNVILGNSLSNDEVEYRNMEMLVSKGVDVIILSGGQADTISPDSKQIERMNNMAKKTPVIVAGTADYFPCSKIKIEDSTGFNNLLDYLLKMGHRKFALLGGIATKSPTHYKQELFKSYLKRNAIPIKDEWIIQTDHYGLEDGYKAAKHLITCSEIPDTVIGINEFVALGAMRAFYEAGYNIPKDISLAGFDNTYLSEISTPRLTSAGCNYDEYGEILMDLVFQVTMSEKRNQNVIVPTRLTVRDSCGISRNKGE